MTDFVISAAHNNARLAATISFADAGTAASTIEIYDAADVLLATIHLAKPCGVVASDLLVLTQADPTADLITTSGTASRATWRSGSGLVVAQGPVTDATGDGPFVLAGAAGLVLYAGGLAVLGTTAIS